MAGSHGIESSNKTAEVPAVREIGIPDIVDALKRGIEDFWDKPSHYAFICLIYPVMGLILITWSSGSDTFQLVYPLMTGFALLGPLAAIGLYEISRRRELGLDTSWVHALEVRNSPAIPAMLAVGAWLVLLFVAWLYTAQALYEWLYSSGAPKSFLGMVADVLTTGRGWALIILGNLLGLVFALVVLSTTVIAFPLLRLQSYRRRGDPDFGQGVLRQPDSHHAVGFDRRRKPGARLDPLLVGLAVVIPVLGHSTWHLSSQDRRRPRRHGRWIRNRATGPTATILTAVLRDGGRVFDRAVVGISSGMGSDCEDGRRRPLHENFRRHLKLKCAWRGSV